MIDKQRRRSVAWGCAAIALAYAAGVASMGLLVIFAQHISWHG